MGPPLRTWPLHGREARMTALDTVLLLFAACLGAGAAVLACVRVLGDFDRGEAVAWSFASGPSPKPCAGRGASRS